MISAQPTLDAVLFVHILLIALHFLVPSYRGVFFGHIYPQKLGTGIQLTLEAMTSKDSMDTRYGDILLRAINKFLILYFVMKVTSNSLCSVDLE